MWSIDITYIRLHGGWMYLVAALEWTRVCGHNEEHHRPVKPQARLLLMADGTVTLFSSTVEIGQGAHTALAQITAEKVLRALRDKEA